MVSKTYNAIKIEDAIVQDVIVQDAIVQDSITYSALDHCNFKPCW